MVTVTTLLLTAMLALMGDGKPARTRLYVFTATSASGQHTEEEKGRLAAVEDLREALRKKGITLLDDKSQADVQVEVVGREQREASQGGFGGKQLTALGDTIIRVHAVAGDEQADLKGIGQGTWGRAAKDAADRIVKWIARLPRKGLQARIYSRGIESPPSTLMTLPVA